MNRTHFALLAGLMIGLAACGDDDGPTAVNQTPVADAGQDAVVTDTDGNGVEGVTLDGSGSVDPDGLIEIYRWTLTTNGDFVATGVTPTPDLPVGVWDLTLTVTDDDGATDTDEVRVTVLEQPGNDPPIADAGVDQTVIDADGSGDEIVTLDGTASSDPDGEISVYSWTEGETEIATGPNPQVTLAVGVHTITLTVTDDLIATDTDEVVITVDPQQ